MCVFCRGTCTRCKQRHTFESQLHLRTSRHALFTMRALRTVFRFNVSTFSQSGNMMVFARSEESSAVAGGGDHSGYNPCRRSHTRYAMNTQKRSSVSGKLRRPHGRQKGVSPRKIESGCAKWHTFIISHFLLHGLLVVIPIRQKHPHLHHILTPLGIYDSFRIREPSILAPIPLTTNICYDSMFPYKYLLFRSSVSIFLIRISAISGECLLFLHGECTSHFFLQNTCYFRSISSIAHLNTPFSFWGNCRCVIFGTGLYKTLVFSIYIGCRVTDSRTPAHERQGNRENKLFCAGFAIPSRSSDERNLRQECRRFLQRKIEVGFVIIMI